MGSLWNLQCQLLVAIQNNDLASVHQLLEQGVDSDVRFQIGSQKRPAVCICAERGNLSMVQLLVHSGCSVNQADSSGLTPLHIAVSYGHDSLLGLLLKHRANVSAITNLGYTPLHLAAQRGSADMIQMLIKAGSDLERLDREGKTALVHACIHGNTEVIKYLVEKGADVNTCDSFGNMPLLFATSALIINIEVVELLIKHGAKVDSYNRSMETPLLAATTGRRSQKMEAVKVLINSGCHLNLRTGLGHTALHLAILEHEEALVEMLVRAGCDLNTQDELGLTPLFHLARDSNRKLVELLVAAGVNLSAEAWLRDDKLVSEIKDNVLKVWLKAKVSEFPSLTMLCRKTIRKYYGRHADWTISNLPDLPSTLRQNLMLNAL